MDTHFNFQILNPIYQAYPDVPRKYSVWAMLSTQALGFKPRQLFLCIYALDQIRYSIQGLLGLSPPLVSAGTNPAE
jgi:hypothetical protein